MIFLVHMYMTDKCNDIVFLHSGCGPEKRTRQNAQNIWLLLHHKVQSLGLDPREALRLSALEAGQQELVVREDVQRRDDGRVGCRGTDAQPSHGELQRRRGGLQEGRVAELRARGGEDLRAAPQRPGRHRIEAANGLIERGRRTVRKTHCPELQRCCAVALRYVSAVT